MPKQYGASNGHHRQRRVERLAIAGWMRALSAGVPAHSNFATADG